MTFDEAYDGDGTVRPAYADVLAALQDVDLAVARKRVDDYMRAREVSFGEDGGPFVLDPVPRILLAREWRALAAGLEQRVRALGAFFRDAYGAREVVSAGVLPAHVIEEAENYERSLDGRLPDGPLVAIAGIDVVRDADGRFYVLEDNLRTPSGVAYQAVARETLAECLSLPGSPWDIDPVGELCRAIAAAGDRPVVLTDGPPNSAFFEHRAVARALGAPLVTLADLDVRADGVFCDGTRIDVIYRRTNTDTLTSRNGSPTEVGAALAEAWLDGRVTLLNAFGAGIADDKLVHAYVEDMVSFYLGEEPMLASVPTHDPGEPDVRADTLERLDELVVKPRAESGGVGVVIGTHASEADRDRAADDLRADPSAHVVQDTVWLSQHPTVAGGALEPRRVDLRAFVVCAGEEVLAIPGGLTRYALERDALVVNSSQGGGAKDTWVVG